MRLLENIHNVDVLTFGRLARIRHRASVINVARAVSLSADGPLYFLIGFFFLYLGYTDLAKLLALGFVIERSAYKLFKTVFKRNRPPEAIPGFQSVVIPPDQFSFPSGHTSAAFLFAACFTFAFPAAAPLFYMWASSVAAARVLLGVHFPTDVLAGAALGSSIYLATAAMLF